MFWLVAILLFFILGVAVLELLQQDSGYVLISLAGVTIETSFWFALFVVTVVALLVFGVLFLFKSSFSFLSNQSDSMKKRRRFALESSYRQALLHYFTGNYRDANTLFARLSRKTELPIVRALASAHSLARSAESAKAYEVLEHAEKTYPNESLWFQKAKLALQFDVGDIEGAKQTLSKLQTIAKDDYVVKQFGIKLLSATHESSEAVDIVLNDARVKSLPSPDSNLLVIEAFESLRESKDASAAQVDQLWSKSTKEQKANADIQFAYTQALIAVSADKKAKKFIEKTLSKVWNAELVRLYAKTDFGDLDAQLNLAETWLKHYAEEFRLYIALAVLCIKNQYWGKAKSFLNKSLEIEDSTEAWFLLGDISEKLGEHKESVNYYKRSAQASYSSM